MLRENSFMRSNVRHGVPDLRGLGTNVHLRFAAKVGSPSFLLSATASRVNLRTVAALIVSPSSSTTVAISYLPLCFRRGSIGAQPLSAPEPKQDSLGFSANEQDRAIRQIDQVSPLDFLLDCPCGANRGANFFDAFCAASPLAPQHTHRDLQPAFPFALARNVTSRIG